MALSNFRSKTPADPNSCKHKPAFWACCYFSERGRRFIGTRNPEAIDDVEPELMRALCQDGSICVMKVFEKVCEEAQLVRQGSIEGLWTKAG
jgi:hypothetical protein